MKSAYELAMEKLRKDDPDEKISESQKKKLAEIDSFFRSKIAEKEILMKPQILEAKRMGDEMGATEIERRMADELRKLREESEREKQKVRKVKKS